MPYGNRRNRQIVGQKVTSNDVSLSDFCCFFVIIIFIVSSLSLLWFWFWLYFFLCTFEEVLNRVDYFSLARFYSVFLFIFNPLPLELIDRCTLQKTQSLDGHPLLCMMLVMTLVGVWFSLDHIAC